jgi:hypothetical protein
MKTLIRALCLLFLLFSACSLDNGAALLPPLIISTEKMGCQVNEVSARNPNRSNGQYWISQIGIQISIDSGLLASTHYFKFRVKEICRQGSSLKIQVDFLRE